MKTKEVLALLKTLHIGESEKPVLDVVVKSLEQEKKDAVFISVGIVGFTAGALLMALVVIVSLLRLA